MIADSKPKKSCISFESCFGTFYDILGQIISILDVLTDIIVCIGFYQKNRMPFFAISVTIILLAFIAYDIAFVARFGRGDDKDKICLFFVLLPLTPLLPFVFYFTDSKDRFLARFLKDHFCFTLRFDDKYKEKDTVSKLRVFMQQKVSKHFGFIIEALVEAFPQAILQLIAIVIFKEANIVSIISILLSMLSVASKSFVFSIATALNLKQLFFNWLCAITDFFGIFVAICWVFYEPENDNLSNAFITIRNIWFYKLIICEFIFIGGASITLHISCMVQVCNYEVTRASTICGKICVFIFWLLLISFLWGCGIIASILALEITCWTYIPGILFYLGTKRFSEKKNSSQFWFTIINWINSAEKHRVGSIYKGITSYTKKQDKMMRICAVNYVILDNTTRRPKSPNDRILLQYLNESREKNQYLDVTMNGIRSNSYDPNRSELLKKFWYRLYGTMYNEYGDNLKYYWNEWRNSPTASRRRDLLTYGPISIGVNIATFILGPIYILGRFMTILFPWFIVLYLYLVYNVNIWSNTEFIDMFQVVMITIYLFLCVILLILFYMNCYEQYLLAHLLPSEAEAHISFAGTSTDIVRNEWLKDITNHYYGIIVIPIRKAIVIDKFGTDLGSIILSYLPLNDNYDNAHNQVIKPKIVV